MDLRVGSRALFGVVLSLTIGTAAAGCSTAVEGEDADAIDSEISVGEVIQKGTVLRVTASALNVRERGTTQARILTQVRRDQRVTCAVTSGETGWVNITTANGVEGWVHGKYVVRVQGESTQDPTGGDEPAPAASGGTCSPSRAASAVGRYQKALHDTLAYAEGTRGHSRDGYDVMFSFKLMSSCGNHPNQCIRYGSSCSTAAGRYQFLKKTWDGVANARGFSTFEPENQERGAAYLIANVRRVTVPTDRAMSATEFSNAMSKLSYEWASLPPGRYGQPNKSASQMRSMYCSIAGC